ncbi:MAG TPA: N-acetylglucosamine-6-phosphate deacetylase [Trueperaceae bacterium]|nr:N-acetylglucosamine-6-phosphate deacetylase [Trueperaceae bacterium]
MRKLNGTLLLPNGAWRGTIEFAHEIVSIEVTGVADLRGASGPIIAPGFIDTHVHGGAGGDTMDGADGAAILAGFHLKHGTTTLLPTTMTAPFDRVLAALKGVAELVEEQRAAGGAVPGLPTILGAHLEGPFISPHRLGAQPAFAVEPTPEAVTEVLATGVVRVVTIAPEVEGAVSASRAFAAAGTRVSIGHTVADSDAVTELAAAVTAAGGTLGFTHLFNAMPGLGSREPGVVGAALADDKAYAELILDLHHVHPVSFMAVAAAKPGKLHLITDAIRATGSGAGVSELGGQQVLVAGGAARLADGTLAGSVLTLDVAMRNAVAAGVSVSRAATMISSVPAAYLGLRDRGALAVGLRADMVVLDSELLVEDVYVGGRSLAGSG